MELKTIRNADDAEMLIYGQIGVDPFFGDGISAESVARELKSLGKVKALTIRINSGGGSVFEGQTIYNYLRDFKAKKTVKVDSLAGSIASVIALAGDHVEIADNARFMIHNPYGGTLGDAAEHRKTADVLDKLKEDIITVYANKSGRDRKTLSKLMDAETWLGAEEALALGFADSIKQNAPRIAACVSRELFAKMRLRNVPSDVFEIPKADYFQKLYAKMRS